MRFQAVFMALYSCKSMGWEHPHAVAFGLKPLNANKLYDFLDEFDG
jgi:hypothetical protein